MSAAQLDMSEQEETFASALKQQVAERLASHRSRRMRMTGDAAAHGPRPEAYRPDGSRLDGHGPDGYRPDGNLTDGNRSESDVSAPPTSRSSQIAAAVAERYAQQQSYRVFLAAEAEKAMAAAEVAARSAAAIAGAQQALLDELHAMPSAPAESSGGFKVRLYEDVGRPTPEVRVSAPILEDDPDESRTLDEEIAFRLAPEAEEYAPAVGIPGNLLEFPRQLVAPRKARPRCAEGPLAADASQQQEGAQLRIFEVDATQISSAAAVESVVPEWSSIWLDALAVTPAEKVEEVTFSAALKPQTAAMSHRVMAATVDAALILTAFLAFATMFAYRAAALPSLSLAAAASAVTLATLFLGYRMLFFTFSDATPGMRYARIGLCTFGDDNPTRSAMRRRTVAILLAACPLGMGLLWAWLDEDRLGWHDRISRMYPRSY